MWSNLPPRDGTEPVVEPVFDSELHAGRVAQYLAMGFAELAAELLATARETEKDPKGRTWERPLWPGRVRQALDRGCTHEQVVAIYA